MLQDNFEIYKEKLQSIIDNYTVEIYKNNKQFSALISDLFLNDDFSRLLRIIIEKDKNFQIYQLKDSPLNDLYVNYQKVIDNLSSTTFISKETIIPAIDLLCFGLNIEINHNDNFNITPIVDNNFEIIDNILVKYNGNESFIVVPDKVTKIEKYAFYNNQSIKSITLPETVESIGDSAFEECHNLKLINIPPATKLIGEYAFNKCNSLITIDVPNSTAVISKYAFAECTSLITINIADDVIIDDFAFIGCKMLDSNSRNRLGWV